MLRAVTYSLLESLVLRWQTQRVLHNVPLKPLCGAVCRTMTLTRMFADVKSLHVRIRASRLRNGNLLPEAKSCFLHNGRLDLEGGGCRNIWASAQTSCSRFFSPKTLSMKAEDEPSIDLRLLPALHGLDPPGEGPRGVRVS